MWIVSGPMSTAPLDGDGIEARRFMVGRIMARACDGSEMHGSDMHSAAFSPRDRMPLSRQAP